MSLSWPGHLITLAEWEALPEDETLRLEVVEGMLAVSAKPMPWHQMAAVRMTYRLNEQLPPTLTALAEVEALLAEELLTIRVPDVLVTSTTVYEANPPRLPATEIRLVVEILSDGSRRVDRVMKFAEYAEAAIPRYWILDLEAGPELTAYVLVGGVYELAGRHRGRAAPEVDGPPVTLDLDALVRRSPASARRRSLRSSEHG